MTKKPVETEDLGRFIYDLKSSEEDYEDSCS